MNVKLMLIEKERQAYMDDKPTLANFFDATLQYILELEEEINTKDAKLAEYDAREKSKTKSGSDA